MKYPYAVPTLAPLLKSFLQPHHSAISRTRQRPSHLSCKHQTRSCCNKIAATPATAITASDIARCTQDLPASFALLIVTSSEPVHYLHSGISQTSSQTHHSPNIFWPV
ncbi:hypothetical protein ACN47E_009475 [Coniothyrium glycines]